MCLLLETLSFQMMLTEWFARQWFEIINCQLKRWRLPFYWSIYNSQLWLNKNMQIKVDFWWYLKNFFTGIQSDSIGWQDTRSFLNSAKLQWKWTQGSFWKLYIFFIISAASGGNSVSGAVENGGGGSSSNNQAQPSENQKMEDKRFPKCRLCNYRYFTRLDLCRHFVDYHLRSRLEKCLDPASQRCPACALTYDKKQSRLRHFIWSHQDLEGLVVQDAQVRLSEFMPSLRYFKNSSY